VNGESLLGTRHKRAVDIIASLHDTVHFLICDGYSDAGLLQPVSAKVSHRQGHTGETSQGHVPQFEGHKTVTEKVDQGQELEESVHEKVNQGEVQCQDHKVAMDRVGQDQRLVFEGQTEVNGISESTVDEHRRERARQRRLARYCKSHYPCLFSRAVFISQVLQDLHLLNQ